MKRKIDAIKAIKWALVIMLTLNFIFSLLIATIRYCSFKPYGLRIPVKTLSGRLIALKEKI